MTENSASHGWTECRTHENYPVIGVVFADGTERFPNVVLFDSGADATYIASELIKREGLEDDDAIVASDDVNGFPLARYVLNDVSVQLSDGVHTRTGLTTVNVVINWTSSAFSAGCAQSECISEDNVTGVCAFRTAVVSTRVLADIGVSLILDGEARTTTIRTAAPVNNDANSRPEGESDTRGQ